MKTCRVCHENMEITLFRKNKNCKGGINTICILCDRLQKREFYACNKSIVETRNLKWVSNNKEWIKEYQKIYYRQNFDIIKRRTTMWVKDNLEKVKARVKNYRIQNQYKFNQLSRARTAMKLKATVSWANKFYMNEIYHLAQLRTKLTGIKWHVDHIVPLKGKNVCGLHVENNLRVILAVDNLRKYNNYMEV